MNGYWRSVESPPIATARTCKRADAVNLLYCFLALSASVAPVERADFMRILHDYNYDSLEEQVNDFFKLKCYFDMLLGYLSECKQWSLDDSSIFALEDISDHLKNLNDDLGMTLSRIQRAAVPPEAEEGVEVFFSPKEPLKHEAE